ncbi:MAG TPA: hypothetical protein VN879_10580 [Candidatus Acidoferrales bacterium]|jgi:hypothetical protein|nr:hypothetical protein [Candidatus Acidoferrales bacterium]
MATRKMTFTLPEDLAEQFVRRVPARERSKYLANALNEKLSARDRHLVEACRIANNDPEVRAIEKEFDAITEEAAEPWSASAPRRSLVGKTRSHTRRRNS